MQKIVLAIVVIVSLSLLANAQPGSENNLVFDSLAARWDEAIPQGNGMLGALVWQKNGRLRLSLDRADLWDERPAIDLNKFNFKWVQQHVANNDYDTVQHLGDDPYEAMPYPTKIPAGALEFDISALGKVQQAKLDIATALCTVTFANGTVFTHYIHAAKNSGSFSITNLPSASLLPQLIIPGYTNATDNGAGNSVDGLGLQRLGYAKGTVTQTGNSIVYHQPTTGNNYYELLVTWQTLANHTRVGQWTITNNKKATLPALMSDAKDITDWDLHKAWWKKFWQQSSVSIPDKLLQKQYYLEMYKLGCVARNGAPAITLQAVWTADNGSLPPWKGDFHHDLNTQLSYWPCYTGNHLQEAATYTDWLWGIKTENEKFTKQYFGVPGLAVPGVTTLTGKAMGGWIQYSLSPATASWLAQHFYWQWKYSMDSSFLKTRAYPYLHEAATFIENITTLQNGVRVIPLSSSPEYHNNSIKAWFTHYTNYDLSLYRFALTAAADAAAAMHNTTEALHWKSILQQMPNFDVNETGLTIAPGQNLDESHRHLAQLMAVYPMAQLDVNDAAQKAIIDKSLHQLQIKGTRNWCGYSFSWAASVYARAHEADSAVKQLQIFASNFCSVNSFHLNGDQKGGQYSSFTYRPFTLEGNFAFAQGVQELLLQSKNGYVEVFPAVPQSWQNVYFTNLRAEGAFLISAKKENGSFTTVSVLAEQGGVLRIKLPFEAAIVGKAPVIIKEPGVDSFKIVTNNLMKHIAAIIDAQNITTVHMKKGETLLFKP